MPGLHQVLTRWTTPAGGGFVSVMYFDSNDLVASQRYVLDQFWSFATAQVNSGVSYSIDQSGSTLDVATGTLTGTWTDATGYTGNGGLSSTAVPDAAQVLFRWKTATIVGGRFLQGRTFMPGLGVGAVLDGNLTPAALDDLTDAAEAFVTTSGGFMIWHRPVASSGGVAYSVESGTVWPELAVLRRRRQ